MVATDEDKLELVEESLRVEAERVDSLKMNAHASCRT